MVIAVTIQKGGVGKTTTAAILAQAAAYKGARVLAVDADPQANFSLAMGARISKDTGNSFKMLTGAPAVDQIQRTAQGIEMIPAGRELATLKTGKGSARRLQEAIDPIRGAFDIIIIDTPGIIGELQYNAMQAADMLIIPLEADIYNIQSLYQTMDTARQIRQSNAELKAGFIINKYRGTTNIDRQLQNMLINKGVEAGAQYLGTVRQAVAVKEAALLRQSLYEYAPKSNPAREYMDIFNTITNNKYA